MVLELTKHRLNSAESRIDKFIDSNIMDWASTELLEPVKTELLAGGLSQNAADAVSLQKTGFMKVEVHWDYRGPNDEPLHFFIEYDTRPHFIEAKGKVHGGADALSWVDSGGKRVFRTKVYHPGTTGKMILHNAVEKYKPALRQRIIEETNNYMLLVML